MTACRSALILATELERTYVKLSKEVSADDRVREVEDDRVWGCTRCSDFLKDRDFITPGFVVGLSLPCIRLHILEK